jgi:hypothetical protein
MQKWDKEQKPATAVMKQEGNRQDLQENHWTGYRKGNCQIYCWVAKDHELAVVEGSAPTEMEEPTSTVSVNCARNVGAPATRDSFALTVEKKKHFG